MKRSKATRVKWASKGMYSYMTSALNAAIGALEVQPSKKGVLGGKVLQDRHIRYLKILRIILSQSQAEQARLEAARLEDETDDDEIEEED